MKTTVTDGPDGKIIAYHRVDGRLHRIITNRPNGKPRYVQHSEGGLKFMRGKLPVLEELEVYRAMNAGPCKYMLPRSVASEPLVLELTQPVRGASSASSSASAAAAEADPPSDNG